MDEPTEYPENVQGNSDQEQYIIHWIQPRIKGNKKKEGSDDDDQEQNFDGHCLKVLTL